MLDDFSRGAEHPSEVETAIWFHDAIYDPRRHDNEARSADWAVGVLRRALAGEAATGRVRDLVLATRHDGPAATADQRLLLDVDLAILGRSPAEFQRCEDEIRREYAWVPEAIDHERRADLLEGFLRRDPLSLTPELRSRFEAQARTILTASIREHRNRLAARDRGDRSHVEVPGSDVPRVGRLNPGRGCAERSHAHPRCRLAARAGPHRGSLP